MMVFDYKRFLLHENKSDISSELVYSELFSSTMGNINSDISNDIMKLKRGFY